MRWVKTLVFRVRLCTSPLRSTISKAKLPFWLTGEKVSRLRCPLRTPGTLLDKLADAGADTGASCLVSIGCGMAFGAVNKVFGFDGSTSAMFDLPITVSSGSSVSYSGSFDGAGRLLVTNEAGYSRVRVLMGA